MVWPALIAPALIAAGASVAGGMFANQANKRLSRENRAWQERMSSTAYQRAVTDMRAAGLNPAMMYASAQPASTPQGGVIPMQDVGTPAVSSALSALMTQSQTANINMETKRVSEEVYRIASQTDLNDAQINEIDARIQNFFAQTEYTDSLREATDYENVSRRILAEFYDNNDMALIAKEFGVNASTVTSIVEQILSPRVLRRIFSRSRSND